MPVKRNITLNLLTREVFRREGFREYSKIRPEMKSLIHELLECARHAHLLEPAVAYETYHVTGISHHELCMDNNVVLQGPLLPKAGNKLHEPG